MVFDVLVSYETEEKLDGYLVQCHINIQKVSVFRQACKYDIPDVFSLPPGYEGKQNFDIDEFTVLVVDGIEYLVIYPYEQFCIIKQQSV